MTGAKIYMLFTFPVIFDLYYRIMQTGEFEFNPVLLMIAIIASIIGSTVQATHTSLKRKVLIKEIIAIYVTGLFIAYFAYELGNYYDNFTLTGLSSAIFSYVSIDFVVAMRDIIIKRLPKALMDAFRNFINSGNKDN